MKSLFKHESRPKMFANLFSSERALAAWKNYRVPIFVSALFILSVCYGLLSTCLLNPPKYPKVNPSYDLFKYYYQMNAYAVHEIANGHFPLWNPWQACGLPFMATNTVGLFYPLNVAYLFMPTHIAMVVTFILHLALSGVFTYLCARGFGISRYGASVAAITFMFAGHLAFHMSQPCNYHSAVWLPLMLLLTKRICDKPNLINVLLLSFFSTVQFMAGFAQYYVYTLYLMSGYVSFHLVRHVRMKRGYREAAQLIGWLLIAGVSTFGFSAIQALPSMETSFLSCRSLNGLTSTQISEMRHIGSVASSYKFSAGAFLKAFIGTGPSFFYSGLFPLILLPFSWVRGKQRFNLTFFILVVFCCSIISMVDLGGWIWVLRIPTISMFRMVGRILFIVSLCLAMMAGIGWDELWRFDSKLKKMKSGGSVGILFVLATATVFFWIMAWTHRMDASRSIYVLMSLALACSMLFLSKFGWQFRLVQLFLMMTLITDLASKNFVPVGFPTRTPAVFHQLDRVWEFLRDHEGHDRCYFDSVIGEKYGQLESIRTITDYEPFSSRRLRDYMAFLQRRPFPSNHVFYGQLWDFRPDTVRMRFLNLMAVRYFLIYYPAWFMEWWDSPPQSFRLVYEEDRVRIYENPLALPRAYVVHNARVIEDAEKLLEKMDSTSFDPSREVLLLEHPSEMEVADSGSDADQPAEIHFVRDEPEEVRLLIRTERPGFLILSDSDFPGWKAAVNGTPTKIFRANYLFRAVRINGGESMIEFRYEPDSFRRGAQISSITLVIWIAVGIVAVLVRKKKEIFG